MFNLIDHLEVADARPARPHRADPPGRNHPLHRPCLTDRGATDTSVWQVEIEPGTPATPHSLTREEVFVVLAGRRRSGSTTPNRGSQQPATRSWCRLASEFALDNAGDDVLRLVCCLPVGGQATLADGTTFTPPWAE